VAVAAAHSQRATFTHETLFAGIDAFVESQMRAGQIPGLALAIVQDGKVVHLRGFGVADATGRAVTPQTPFIVGSVGKTFTGLAIRQLINKGLVELDAPVQRYVPWFRVADARASAQITVRHLLEHTSGIPRAAGEQAYQMEGGYTTEQLVRMVDIVQLNRPVGSSYEYSNINFLLLGLIVEAASGQPFKEYAEQQIFAPLEMRHTYLSESKAVQNGLATGYRTYFGLRVPAHVPFPTGMLPSGYGISTAEDLGNYLIAYLNDGNFNGRSVTEPSGRAKPQSSRAYYYDTYWDQKPCPCNIGSGQSGGTLNYNAYVYLWPGNQWGVAVLMNTRSMLDDFLYVPVAASIGQGVMSRLDGRESPPLSSLDYTAWYVLVDFILLLLAAFALAQVARFGHWQRVIRHASTWTWLSTVAIGLLSVLLGLLFVFGIPVLFNTNWAYMFATLPDIYGVLFSVGIVLLVVTAARVVVVLRSRLLHLPSTDTTSYQR
jgi:CubicO group peptidase (beta-lactamase class C family)